MKQLKVILIGAGNRGQRYTNVMAELPEMFKIIAVADKIENRRNYIKEKHHVDENMVFDDWTKLLNLGKIADVAIIATMDQLHVGPALKAIELGYDLLLEKPISNTSKECDMVAKAATKKGTKVVICTVLRYTPFFNKIKELIDTGKIGKIMAINHEECVGNTHQSHSFVRGNWGNKERSSCMLLQKSCHDMDILQWLVGSQVSKIQSFGSLSYFTKENAPDGAPDYCIEGCPQKDCPYNAVKLYLDDKKNDWFRDAAAKKVNASDQDVIKAISETQYGKCVFKCDNNVVDHQVVNLEFENGAIATFSMNAFNKGGRFINIYGTKGEIRAALDGVSPIKLFDFATRKTIEFPMENSADGVLGGHGGGDGGIITTFYNYITGNYKGKQIDSIQQVANNHQLCFAAEESRLTGKVVDFKEFLKKNNY